MKSLRFEWRSYVRPFARPLLTAYGEWQYRAGILIRLTAENERVGYGEIAPMPWFGSETLEQALAWCGQLPSTLDESAIFSIPDTLPCCQFGLESAWTMILADFSPPFFPMCALLSTGERALSEWAPLWRSGYRTFKWKIAVAEPERELDWFAQLHTQLPAETRLRLDANGGLTLPAAEQWLVVCDRLSIEYLEQPLPPDQLDEMLILQKDHSTAIALDESVATLAQLQACLDHGWQGVVVIKPAIAGSPTKLRHLCQTYNPDLVFSSAFETAIGRQAGLHLAATLNHRDRALGYGTSQWFRTDPQNFNELWQHL